MGFLDRLRSSEKRSQRVASSDPYLGEFLGMRGSGAVDVARASSQPVAYACRNLIARSLASVPCKLYRRQGDGGRLPATGHPLYTVLQFDMAPGLTAFNGREWLIHSLTLYGNALARIERNGRGQVTALTPVDWPHVTVERLQSGRRRYRIGTPGKPSEVRLDDEVLHILDTTRDGLVGVSPVRASADAFNLALSQADEARSLSENAFRPSGALVFNAALTPEQRQSVNDTFLQRFVGALKSGKPLVLDNGADFKTFSHTPKDAELVESRKLSNLDICRIYNVPPSAVGITDNATYSNIEEESRALVVRCLAPWARRIEQAMNAALLTPESRKIYFIEHDLAGLLRGDLKGRYEAYRIGKEWGWLSTNEIRGLENLPAVDGGDQYLSPLNMAPVGQEAQAA